MRIHWINWVPRRGRPSFLLCAVAFIAQILSLALTSASRDTSGTFLPSVGMTVTWCAALYVYVFVSTHVLWQWVMRGAFSRIFRRAWDRLRYWGTEDDAFGAPPDVATMVTLAYFALSAAGTAWAIANALIPNTPDLELDPGLVVWGGLPVVVTLSLFWGTLWISAAGDKTRELGSLSMAFREHLPKSEILSVYEALRPVSPLLWNEFKGLHDWQANSATCQQYRDRAIPFRLNQDRARHRVELTVAVVVLSLTALTALYLLSEGTAFDWVKGWFMAAP